ncbi:MAG: cytochrome c biogenesis heme-transporting ATPase CcmA [Gammaproteobacteria bacterium]|nr:cytochrome c biogenesis heme-transporting ATPase CcmA [Gammaproteobacteria bacterium]NNJ73408.1 cytochrome c biogenesis heme-transporting ATPase CcmA [Enterobacterales bacterium]
MADIHPLLKVNKLGLRRSERWLFRDLNFQLNTNEVVHITGENGIGKTSLLRCLCGLLSAQEGDITWLEENDLPLLPLFFGHAPTVKPELTVLENLLLHPLNRQYYTEAVWEEALHTVGLGNYLDAMAKNLSAGQTRRVALARLLVSDAKCWILDEPFTALDVTACKWLSEVISDYASKGGSVLMTSHQPVVMSADVKVMEIKKDMSNYA